MSARPATAPGWPWSTPFPLQAPQPHRRLVTTELVHGTTVELGDALPHSNLTLMLQGQLGAALTASGHHQRHRPTSTHHKRQPTTLPVLACDEDAYRILRTPGQAVSGVDDQACRMLGRAG